MTNEQLLTKLKNVPKQPGVYLWKNAQNEVIYVGKSKNLFHRMHQYFEGSINSYKTTKMVSQICDFDIFVVKSDKEAYILERNYIETYNPKYNLQLLDDKRYPYLNISFNNNLYIKSTFRITKSTPNNFYFGPFTRRSNLRELVHILQRLFLYKNGLPILNETPEFWKNKFEAVIETLKLKNSDILKQIHQKMLDASDNLNFELALEYKKALNVLNELKERQISELTNFKNIDVFSFKEKDNYLFILIVVYRFGVQISHFSFDLQLVDNLIHTIDSFIEQYYEFNEIPDTIVLNSEFQGNDFNSLFANKIVYPKIGILKQLIMQADQNNIINQSLIDQYKLKEELNVAFWDEMRSIFGENVYNQTIYLFDNSTINNQIPSGVAVAYRQGKEAKSLYRKFNHTQYFEKLKGQGDVQLMYLTATRFFYSDKNILSDGDIIICDGGFAQIQQVLYALKENQISTKIQVFGLVKDDKHRTRKLVNKGGIEINVSKLVFNFLARMQVEVNRFAKSFMRKRHTKSNFSSQLQQIKGIGLSTEQKLLATFETYSNIYNASEEELAKVVGKKVAKNIKESIKN
ncbi:GIY-YIG nuclease family protein [Mycoplasma corogypsi]|uniref:GIY-YIG nuclease family protein n=1 Tax=Mycoplasma corogypsi TaxID=2106 RepID=UPI003873B326